MLHWTCNSILSMFGFCCVSCCCGDVSFHVCTVGGSPPRIPSLHPDGSSGHVCTALSFSSPQCQPDWLFAGSCSLWRPLHDGVQVWTWKYLINFLTSKVEQSTCVDTTVFPLEFFHLRSWTSAEVRYVLELFSMTVCWRETFCATG